MDIESPALRYAEDGLLPAFHFSYTPTSSNLPFSSKQVPVETQVQDLLRKGGVFLSPILSCKWRERCGWDFDSSRREVFKINLNLTEQMSTNPILQWEDHWCEGGEETDYIQEVFDTGVGEIAQVFFFFKGDLR